MASLLERELLFVTGKGGTGKTTIAGALGLLASRRGRRTLLVEVGGHGLLPPLLGEAAAQQLEPGEERQIANDLWSLSLDADRATIEWLRAVAGRAPARFLASSSTFRYFAAAAPGAKELVTMVKLLDLCARYELVVMDAPATGHALAMLRSPQTFSAIARIGPLAARSEEVRALLGDHERSGYLAVAHAGELAVSETLELEQGLRDTLGRELDAIVVNAVLPNRFTREEIERLPDGHDDPLAAAALAAARSAYTRARLQRAQIARLRRQRLAPRVVTVPFQFAGEPDAETLATIAERLGRYL